MISNAVDTYNPISLYIFWQHPTVQQHCSNGLFLRDALTNDSMIWYLIQCRDLFFKHLQRRCLHIAQTWMRLPYIMIMRYIYIIYMCLFMCYYYHLLLFLQYYIIYIYWGCPKVWHPVPNVPSRGLASFPIYNCHVGRCAHIPPFCYRPLPKDPTYRCIVTRQTIET